MLSIIHIILLIFLINFVTSECIQSVTTVSGSLAPNNEICSNQLIFEDNFNKFNLKIWEHESTLGGGGNWEFQWYTNNRSNSFVKDGKLFIKPTLLADEKGENFLYSGTLDINGGSPADRCTNPAWYGCSRAGNNFNILNPIKSARIRTVNSFSFRYGKVEVRAKLPSGDWLWPAIWLLPRDNQYSSWPSSGEIDIMESRGNNNYLSSKNQPLGNQLVSSTLHWGPYPGLNFNTLTHFEKLNPSGFNSDFHNYQMLWTPNNISFSIDDEIIGVVAPPNGGFWEKAQLKGVDNPWISGSKMAPFDQEFYILMNVACGGVSFFPDDATNNPSGKPWKNNSPKAATDFWDGRNQWLPTWELDTDKAALQVDYVRVWAL